jgi:hypothetical protein
MLCRNALREFRRRARALTLRTVVATLHAESNMPSYLRRLTHLLIAMAIAMAAAHTRSADLSWAPTSPDAAYLMYGDLKRASDGGATPWSVLTVGAQINASNDAGVNQIAFGIATEAWAQPGSFSVLTGIEATAINREPNNPFRKISMWSTFKNRPDGDYYNPPADPANLMSQALRIESQPGTGFERAIVFAPISLHASRALARPVAIDFAEMSPEAMASIDVMRFPDGCTLAYLRRTGLVLRCDQ